MGLRDFISRLFGTGKNKTSSSTQASTVRTGQPSSSAPASAGRTAVSRVMSDLGITRPEIDRYMKANNIVPVNDTLTQTQVDRIYDSHYRTKAGESIVARPPVIHPDKPKPDKKKQPSTNTNTNSGSASQGRDFRNIRIARLTHHKVVVQPITSIPNTPIRRSKVPGENDKVYNAQGGHEYTLTRFISSGGEGSIYAVDVPGKIAKIYNDAHCTERVREKIRLMAGSKLKYKGICFPSEVLVNAKGEFCGFIMPEAKGTNLGSLFIPKSEFEKMFTGWKKIDLVVLAISILKHIKYLHEHDILMGDISPSNIMFTTTEEVYFIDTDSYQFGPFPCTVGTNNFVAPELLGRTLGNVMRSQGNENFAIATLLFMLMMNGKQPYSHQGGSQSAADVNAGIFPYGAGERTVKGNVWDLQPVGLWRYLWSHLPLKLKDAFIDTFRKDGRNNTEATRFDVDNWLLLMNAYRLAYSAMVSENDSMSAEIFPTREKKGKGKYYTCSICGEEKPENLFHDPSTCWDCYNERRNQVYTTIRCEGCGRNFTITNGEYEYLSSRGLSLPKRCETCRDARKNNTRRCSKCGKEKPEHMFHDSTTCKECHKIYLNSIYGSFRCIGCGRNFTITNGQYEFFTSKGYELPKRCESCRNAKKGY